jgi:1-acyl-sn-glycerol-3-phosphate acyltransferase
MTEGSAQLSTMERLALAAGRWANESDRGKRAQWSYLKVLTNAVVGGAVGRRLYVDGIDWMLDYRPDRGVVQAANHRSFFDQYVAMLPYRRLEVPWVERVFFPVRSNFFYESPLGLLVNFLIGAGTMYPPVFRDPAKSELTREGINRVIAFLQRPGTLVGMHPEGTRGKGPDPYQLLPAQPGIGQIVLQARPLVIPVFINGLPKDDPIAGTIDNYRAGIRHSNPCIIVYGQPVDYSDLSVHKPRAALYKRCADRIREAIARLGERERELRAACLAGAIGDDHPGWLDNRARARRGNGGG